MSEIMNVTEKTPIEIALQIDEAGYTTTMILYEFLELDPSHYSRWVERNILGKNYVEGIDYISLARRASKDSKGNYAENYKISEKIAKRLAILANNKKGDLVVEYYERVEQALILSIKTYQADIKKAMEIINNQAKTISLIQERVEQLGVLALETKQQSELTMEYTRRSIKYLNDKVDIYDAGSIDAFNDDWEDGLSLKKKIEDEILPLMQERCYKNISYWNLELAFKEIRRQADGEEICHGYTLKAARDDYNVETNYFERNQCQPSNYVVIAHNKKYKSAFLQAMAEIKDELRPYSDEEIWGGRMDPDSFAIYQKEELERRDREKAEKANRAKQAMDELNIKLEEMFQAHKDEPGFGNLPTERLAISSHNSLTGDNFPIPEQKDDTDWDAIKRELGIN